ncbi:uncharacterized protein BX663DRAFT_545457 [Cokeromyces recurvatus]|uniref:uncharacterized protein n=1 Tax=Cokeromyces recurvatus TaxID=90255 RepID=UPI0022209ACE|nr:uncharacterized protein BX663DRAFT_545457 [Cokeromyces recurvatus]KAI7899765.1 hypothetical protein BX663DRAFT_545457 [Cokeromyces recurvatus]
MSLLPALPPTYLSRVNLTKVSTSILHFFIFFKVILCFLIRWFLFRYQIMRSIIITTKDKIQTLLGKILTVFFQFLDDRRIVFSPLNKKVFAIESFFWSKILENNFGRLVVI